MTSLNPDHSSVTLATTWNRNESGTLWERLWMRDADGFYAQLICSGVFVGPKQYADEEEFWRAYESEATKFYGQREGS